MADNVVVEIKNTEAKFLDFANRSFPLDCEGFSDKQLNEKLISVLGNIGGSKYILMGCDAPNGYAGFVFLATIDNPSGELLYVEGAPSAASSLYLKKTTVDITASGYDYVGAYIKRTLAWGVGVENFNWADFKKLRTNADLATDITALQTTLSGVVPEAVGSMKFWAGTVENKPVNWLQCAGQELARADYPELFAVIGIMYGEPSGVSFRLPKTTGRVPVAYDIDSSDFKPIGKTGGTLAVALTTAQMPSHAHDLTVYGPQAQTANFRPAASWQGVAAEGGSTASVGGGQDHTNLQPYMALPFIIKVK